MTSKRLIVLFFAGALILAACAAPVTQATSAATQPKNTSSPTLTNAPPTATTKPLPSATPEVPTIAAPTATDAPAGGVSFSANVLPMLTNSCLNCHGGNKTEEGLSFKTYESLMAGSQNGVVVVAGDAANSFMVESIASGDMPKRGTKWTAEQLQILVDWINQGALNN